MTALVKIIWESISQAFQQMRANKLRTALSLLGVTIGIFCIIAVLSAVDSLEANIRESFEQLGDDVLYISKIPWVDHSRESMWKYNRRPPIEYEDYRAIERRVESAKYAAWAVFAGSRTLQYKSSSLNGAYVFGVTYDYGNILNVQVEKGRYFSPFEYEKGINNILIGHKIAETLFGTADAVGKEIKLSGRSMRVIGVIEESGDALINPVNFDWAVLVSYHTARKITNVNRAGMFLMVKAADNVGMQQLKDEVTVALRSARRVSPTEEDNFAINELSMVKNTLDKVFGVLNLMGAIIGGFATLVGIFSVANIMFVSVKERTRLIGIKKAIGAKRYMILIEFLVETITLCLIGGAIGLVMVFVVMTGLGSLIDFNLFLSMKNILYGVLLSLGIGVVSGIIPAAIAAWMDPVDAMRK